MEHFVSIIDSIVWPATLLIIIFSFKKQLIGILPNINKFKYKDLEIEFSESLNNLSIKTKEKHTQMKTKEEKDFYDIEIDEKSPRVAIIEAWVSLETTIRSVLETNNLIDNNKLALSKLVNILLKNELIEKEDLEIIKELQKLRNDAVHEINFNITKKEAKQFLEVSRNQEDIIASNSWQKFGGCSR